LAPVVGEVVGGLVDGVTGDAGGGPSDQRGAHPAVVPTRGQHADERGEHDQDRTGDPGADPPPLARRGRHAAPTFSGAGSGSETPDADVGAVGRRRLPGKAASAVPRPITPPPIHSQVTRGWRTTRMTTGSPGSSGTSSRARNTSCRNQVH